MRQELTGDSSLRSSKKIQDFNNRQMEEDTIKVHKWGLICDNPICDWRDDIIDFDDYKNYVNMACPKCGENVLTKHDLKNAKRLNKMIKITNNLNRFFGVKVDHSQDKKVLVNTHNDITFKIQDDQ